MENKLLANYTDLERGAYLGAIASIATIDRNASEEELEYLEALCDASDLSHENERAVIQAAKDPSNISLQKCLDTLKGSELRFSLITDIIAFAKADNNYSTEEQQKVKEIASYLQVNENQYSTINQFVDKAADAKRNGEDPADSGFLDKSGFGNMFQKAGIPSGGMMSGLLGMVAPMVLSQLFSRGRRGSMGGGGLLGSILGGAMGSSSMSGRPNSGGLGSVLSNLAGSRGYGGLGSVLGNILSNRR